MSAPALSWSRWDAAFSATLAKARAIRTIPQWQPTARQAVALKSNASFLLYGGSKGGGKTDWLLEDAALYHHRPTYKGIIFRNTFPQLQKRIIPRGLELYRLLDPGVKYNTQAKEFRFSSGAIIYLGYCNSDSEVLDLVHGAEFHYIAFDELTLFKRWWYQELTSTLRGTDDIPLRVRATTNPGGKYPDWVFKAFAPWLDPRAPLRVESDTVLYVDPPDEKGNEAFHLEPGPDRMSRQFISAKVSDNPHLNATYVRKLMELTGSRRRELLEGDWLAGQTRENRVFSHFNESRLRRERLADRDVQYGIGIDYGQNAGHQVTKLLAYSTARKLVQVEAEWASMTRTNTKADARGVVSMLSRIGLNVRDVGMWVGDINSTFKAETAESCNEAMAKAIEELTGFRPKIENPDKRGGSINTGCRRINDATEVDQFSVHESCEQTRTEMGAWEGENDDYKHGIDAMRYIAVPVFDRCQIQVAIDRKVTARSY